MATEIKVPSLGESIAAATVAKWLKRPGDAVARDEPLVELETDKATLELPAPAAGTLTEILVAEGAEVPVGALLGRIAEGAAVAPHPPAAIAAGPTLSRTAGEGQAADAAAALGHPALQPGPPLSRIAGEGAERREAGEGAERREAGEGNTPLSIAPGRRCARSWPRAGSTPRRLLRRDPASGITKADVAAALTRPAPPPIPRPPAASAPQSEREMRVRMTRLRRRIAERLKAAQNTAAMLTTFNEIDMSAVIALRERWRDAFEKRHGVRLGFMSIFVKAAIVGLKEIPAVNAEIDGDDIVYKNHYDIGVAVGAGQGLVVPVLRDADRMNFAAIEKAIAEFGKRAREGKLSIAELSGGTFTISNGGVYGSLLSTPILNPPQSGILGMHKIERRPVAVGDNIEIRPMMYVALSYDHRIVDGREAVGFLVRIKECVEDPARLLLDL